MKEQPGPASGLPETCSADHTPALESLLREAEFLAFQEETQHTGMEKKITHISVFRVSASLSTSSKKKKKSLPRAPAYVGTTLSHSVLRTRGVGGRLSNCSRFHSFSFGDCKLFPSSHMRLATTNWGKLFLVFPLLSIFADLPYLGGKSRKE